MQISNTPKKKKLNPQKASNNTSLFKFLNPAINPNLNLFFPQPVLPSESPATYPVGSSGSNLSNSGGFDGQPPIHDDPNDIATNSLNEKSMGSTGLCNPGNKVLTNQHLKNKVKKTVPHKSKVIQSLRCEVCDIDCNSNDVYEKHISGKKHKKKSEMHNNPATTVFSVAAGEGLETKRQKTVEGGATVVFMRICTVCNLVCNSQEMFDKHLAGKKHAAQARKHPQHGMELPVSAFSNDISGISPTVLSQEHGKGPCESDPNITSTDQFAWCEVCCIHCTSNDILITHKLGKKHLKNLEKLKKTETDTSTPAPADVPITTVPVPRPIVDVSQGETDELKNENAVESHAPRKDSDMKRRKIVEGGADGMQQSVAANPNFVSGIKVLPQDNKNGRYESDPNKTSADQFASCEVCNIYCSSNDVLIVHKMGKKHLKNLEKLAKTKMDTSIPASTHAPVTTVLVPGPMKNSEVSQGETEELMNENATVSRSPREDSEKKRRKIMEGGADGMEQSVAANPNFVSGINPTVLVLPQDNKNGGCESDPNKTSADQFARCEVCNIYCTSNDDLIGHKMGKKHLKNLEKLTRTEMDISIPASTHAPVTAVPVPGPMKNSEVSQGKTEELMNENANESWSPIEDSEKKKRKIMKGGEYGIEQSVVADPDSVSGISPKLLPEDTKNGACESDPNNTSTEEFARCGVCNIYCTSNDGLIIHKSGKKHHKNLEKLKKMETDTGTPASSNVSTMLIPVTGPIENPDDTRGKIDDLKNKNACESQTPKEDLETKKRKIMEVGAAGDAVRVCIICNVVCNSQTVMDSHLAGQKHATMVRRKQAEDATIIN